MASSCMCANDTIVPLRQTYVNLHKWPDSDAAFVRSMSCNERPGGHANPRVVDSISCRQLYLRSYTFSRKKESVPEKISKKCFGRVKESAKNRRRLSKKSIKRGSNTKHVVVRKCLVLRKVKEVSCAAFLSIFRKLLSCTTKVDVVDHHHHGY